LLIIIASSFRPRHRAAATADGSGHFETCLYRAISNNI